jgi:AcrR family transcriptional regulator
MTRTRGARNVDYETHRQSLARLVRNQVVADEGVWSSMRTLAAAADTSIANLKHYFGDREGLLKAVMETIHIDAAPHLAAASVPGPKGTVKASLRRFIDNFSQAWFKFGVGKMQASTLAAGLSTAALGTTYVNHMLEPSLQTFESFVRVHIDRGELRQTDARLAALQFMSPVIMVLLHQDSLHGASCRPLDLEVFFEHHIEVFLRAFGVSSIRV